MASSSTNSAGQSVISDIIIKGDTWVGVICIVQDSQDPSRIFSGTTATVNLVRPAQSQWAPKQTIYSKNLTVDESVPGQVTVEFCLPPTETINLPTGEISGEIIFTFPSIEVCDESLIRTSFLLSLTVIENP